MAKREDLSKAAKLRGHRQRVARKLFLEQIDTFTPISTWLYEEDALSLEVFDINLERAVYRIRFEAGTKKVFKICIDEAKEVSVSTLEGSKKQSKCWSTYDDQEISDNERLTVLG